MGLFRNLFIGKQSIPSRVDYKYALLRSQFAIIMCAIALFYIGLDTYNGVTVFIPFYLLLGGVAIISIFLNRYKYFIAATVVQLMILNTMIFLFADVDHPYGGVLGLIHLSEKTDRPEEIGTLLQMMKDRIKTMEGFYKGGYRLLAQYAP